MRAASINIKTMGNELSIAFAGSILLAFISQFSIPLPFTPVPVTLQTLGIFLIGGLLGPTKGFFCVLFYLLEGSLGLPVFAGGLAKPLWFISSTAGFLFAFLPAVFIIGKLLEYRPRSNYIYIFSTLVLAQIVMYVFGMTWLALFIGLRKAFLLGVLPFLAGAFIKIALATFLLKGLLSRGVRWTH